MWKRGRGGVEAEGMTCTMFPRSHLDHRAGAAPRLGWEPKAGSAAPEQSISSPQEESWCTPGHNTCGEESPKAAWLSGLMGKTPGP